jgi:hypothetical protein
VVAQLTLRVPLLPLAAQRWLQQAAPAAVAAALVPPDPLAWMKGGLRP